MNHALSFGTLAMADSGMLASAFQIMVMEIIQWNIWSVLIKIRASYGSINTIKISKLLILLIIPTNIVGSWDMEKRTMIFNLENWEMIDILFRSFY